MSPDLSPRITRFILPLILLVFAAPFIALLFYAVPATDDFCKATLAFVDGTPLPGVLTATWLYFTHWSSRWLTILIQSSVMSRVDLIAWYGWLLLVLIGSNLISLWYFFRTVFRVTTQTAALMAGVFFAAWIAGLPSPAEEFYWLTGYTEYYLSFTSLLVLISLLCRPPSALNYVLIAALSIAVPAQHEIAGAFLCAVLLGAVAILHVRGVFSRPWKVGLGAAVLSQAVVMLSPGNALRVVQEHRHAWDVRHLPYWMGHAFYHGMTWLSYPTFLLATICIVLLYQSEKSRVALAPVPLKWIGIACAAGMFAVLCEFGLVEMASGNWSPDRVVAWYMFVFWLLFVSAILTGLSDVSGLILSPATRLLAVLIFGVTLVGSANFRSAIEDLRGPAASWKEQISRQFGNHGSPVQIQIPDRYPKLAMHQQLQPDPGCWVNRCLANYLHSDTVIANASVDDCPTFHPIATESGR